MKLILHIGTEKTGSTALQVFLKRHEKALYAEGIIFPDIFQTANAAELYLSGLSQNDSDYLDIRLFGRSTMFRQKYVKQLGEELSRFATASHAEACILSSELLYPRLPDVQSLRRMKCNLFEAFDDVHIVCYIRNQAERALGLTMEVIKNGNYLPQILSPKDNIKLNSSCNYRTVLSRWMEVFPGRVTVRRYERNSLVNADVIDDFLHIIGHPELMSLPKPHEVNRSLTQGQAQILNYLNHKKLSREKKGIIIKSVLASLSDKTLHGKLRATKDIVQYCEREYQESDEWVRATFFPDDHTLWSDSVNADDSQSLVLNQPMLSIVDALIIEQNKWQILLARSVSKLLQPGQLLFLLKVHSLRWMACLYEALTHSPFSALLLRCKACLSRLRHRWWSFRLAHGGKSVDDLQFMRQGGRV